MKESTTGRTLFLISIFVAMTFMISVDMSAQWYQGDLRENLRRLEEDSDRFAKSLDSDLDHSRLNGTNLEDEINGYVDRFEEATDRLKDRYEDQGYAPAAVQEVLERGREIDGFMRRHDTGFRSASDWRRVRNSLTKLAWAYKISWRW